MRLRLAHIINPVKVDKKSDLYYAQPITFESMRRAKECSQHNNNISQFAISYEEDLSIIPEHFKVLPPMSRSVLDYGQFTHSRKLPLVRDVLYPLTELNGIEYVVYTNVDIGLMPYFYDYIFEKLLSGFDCLVINRRTVTVESSLTLIYAQIGKNHPGYDCFVFKKELLRNFELGTACIGANWIGRILLSNLIMYCDSMEIIKDNHLTFHIGEDGAWLSGKFTDYDTYNRNIGLTIIKEFIAKTNNEIKLSKLNAILDYMMAWGDRSRGKRPNKIVSLIQRIRRILAKRLR